MDYVRIYTDNPSPKEIERVAAVLRDGGIIVYPTDTLYAIGCDALNVRAVERICRLKNIDTRKALLSIVCPDLSMLSQYAKVSNAHFKLMRRNLPGAFTFILPTSSQLPHIYKNRKTVGIRVPDNAIARAITRELGNPQKMNMCLNCYRLTLIFHSDRKSPTVYSIKRLSLSDTYKVSKILLHITKRGASYFYDVPLL